MGKELGEEHHHSYKKIPEAGIPMLGKTNDIIAAINTLQIYA